MLDFVICDDNLNILNKLSSMLTNIFTKNDYSAKVSYISDNVFCFSDGICCEIQN